MFRAKWTIENPSTLRNATKEGSIPSESMDYMHIYAGLVACIVVVSSIRAVIYAVFTTLAARNLHNKMFNMVLRAPMVFFERNPVGVYGLSHLHNIIIVDLI